MNRIILLIVITLAAIGCRKEEEDVEPCKDRAVECPKYYVAALFSGYTKQELDTIIVHTFEYNKGFSNKLSTSIREFSKDILKDDMYYVFSGTAITDTLDYMIEVPSTGNKFYISIPSYTISVDTHRCDDRRANYRVCFSLPETIVVNETQKKVSSYGLHYYRVQLIKY